MTKWRVFLITFACALLILPPAAFVADKKITELTADTAPTSDDLVMTVNDPAGTPANRKVTLSNFIKGLSAFTGDTGSGGVKGLVPAPAAGDAAAGKYLKADGTWATVSGGSGIGGSTGSTDNAILRADGTGGSTAQSSALTIADTTGKLTFPASTGDKIDYYNTEYGVGVEANTLTHWAQSQFRFRFGGNSVSGGTQGGLFKYNSGQPRFTLDSPGYFKDSGHLYAAANFSKTNTTLADVTGLIAPVNNTNEFAFEAHLFVTADATGGMKVAVGGSATASTIVYDVVITDATTGAVVAAGRHTSVGGTTSYAGASTSLHVAIYGCAAVNGGDQMAVQFAQNSASGTSTVLAMSHFIVTALD